VEFFAALPTLNLFAALPSSLNPAAGARGAPAPGVRLSLGHSFEVIAPSTVKIVYEDTAVNAIGPDLLARLPRLEAPQLPEFLRPPRDWRAAAFDVTYLDKSMRITVGVGFDEGGTACGHAADCGRALARIGVVPWRFPQQPYRQGASIRAVCSGRACAVPNGKILGSLAAPPTALGSFRHSTPA
jgi:hypothetical protein